MKILRLRSYCYPENVAASAMAEDIEAEYVRRGIVCINYTPMPSRGVSDEVRRKYKKIKYEEFHDGHVIVYRFPMIKEGTNIAQKSLKYLLCTIVEYFKGIRAKDIDLMLCSSTPPTQGMLTALVARRLSRKYGRKVPFVYNLQDIFPDSLVGTGMTRRGSLIWRIGRRMEDFIYRNADRIIVISEDFKRNIMAKGVPESKIVVVPNWADTDGIYPVERKVNVLFDRYGFDKLTNRGFDKLTNRGLERDKFYICYSGTIGHTQNMDLLLDVAKEVKGELKDVRFVIIGEGAAKADVEKRIKEEAIDNVILLPFQPYADIASVFSLGDVGLIISKPGVGSNSVPSKTMNYMAAEKPILASFDKDSALASLIESIGCGVVAEAGSKEELIEAIRKMVADPQLAEKGKLGKNYLTAELDKEKCVKRFVDTLIEAVNCKPY